MPFPYNSQTYFEWMQEIAINHVDILHNPDRTAKHDVSFGEIFISSDPYEKIDVSTFMEDKRSMIKYPLMLSVGTDWEGAGQGSQTHAVINASFIILDKADSSLTDAASKRRAAYVKTERIAQEISGYIKKYFEINNILGSLVNMPVGEKIGPIMPDKTYGTKISFSYVSKFSALCFKQDQFGLLVPGEDTVPNCCTDDTPAPDYCDVLESRMSDAQKECLKVSISNSDDSLTAEALPRTTYELADIIVTVKDLEGNVIGTFVRPAGINVEVSVDAGGDPVGLVSELVDYNSEDIDVFSEDEIY
jgi:hypothetical protein